MSQSPTTDSPTTDSPTSKSSKSYKLPENFAMKLNPQDHGTLHLSVSEKKEMLNRGKMYKAGDLPPGNNVVDGRGGRHSKKRPTTRRLRLRSSKARKARKARTTRRKY